ncbi:MAG: thioredoxin domain-containing protein [Pseudomonadota bacterium]
MLRILLTFICCFFASMAFAAEDIESPASSDEPAYLYTEAPDDRTLGSEDAPNTLIVYASNTCPHCGHWFNKEWPIIKRDLIETGKLRFVFRPFPTQPAQLSLTGFMMAECAADDDYMIVMEDQFARQEAILSAPDGNAIRAEYNAIAELSGLNNEAEITACLNNQAHYDALEAITQKAQAAEIRGVPAFIFDGQIMKGAQDAAAVKAWVEGRSSQP